MAEFTSGPWKWQTKNSYDRLTSRDGNVLFPAVDSEGHPNIIASREDMALIAAGPELYEALDQLVTAISSSSPKSLSEIETANQNAIAALTKARGEDANG